MLDDNYLNDVDHGIINNNIFIEQIRQVYKQVPITIIGPIFGAFVTAAMLNNHVPISYIVSWLMLICFSYGLFIWPWLYVRNNGVSKKNVHRLATLYTSISWIAVSCWGSVSFFLFVPESFSAQLLLAVAVIVGISAIMSSTIIYSPIFYTVLAMSLPMIIVFFVQGTDIHYYLAIGCIGYTVMLFFLHKSLHKSMIDSLRFQFINQQLAFNLNTMKEIADQANIGKSKFLAAISHDLRQPIHAHSLFLGELKDQYNKHHIFSDLINKLEISLESISELFNTLLELSRLESGSVKPDVQSFTLYDLMSRIENEYNIKAIKHGVELRVVKSNVVVRSDKVMLGRIIRNLLDNAIKYNAQGKVLIGCRKKENSLIIQILDNGVGIGKDEQKYIFDEYYQVRNSNKQKSIGVGLGLSVVKEQCELLGHHISLSSCHNKGSVFSIEVPVSDDTSIKGVEYLDGLIDNDLKYSNIIVIDNEGSNQSAIASILLSWDCNVTVGYKVEDVLEKRNSDWIPDIIISDYNLNHGLTGFEAIDKVRKLYGDKVGVAIIADDITEINNNDLLERNIPVLQKPVNPAKLRTLLRFLK